MALPYISARTLRDSPAERRRSRRFFIELPVMVKTATGGFHRIDGITQDLSIDGVFFYADSPIAVDSPLALFTVSSNADMVTRRVPVWFDGKVVRIQEHPDKSGFGIAVAFRANM